MRLYDGAKGSKYEEVLRFYQYFVIRNTSVTSSTLARLVLDPRAV